MRANGSVLDICLSRVRIIGIMYRTIPSEIRLAFTLLLKHVTIEFHLFRVTFMFKLMTMHITSKCIFTPTYDKQTQSHFKETS